MNRTISKVRWQEAQASEDRFWQGLDAGTLLNILADMKRHLNLVGQEQQTELFDGKSVLEIGCGPLGLSIASFYDEKTKIKKLVKSDPLPRIDIKSSPLGEEHWAMPMVEWAHSLSEEGEYIQGSGEKLSLEGTFDTVLIHNVLDHVHQPEEILKNAASNLRTGGQIAHWVDCFSVLGKLKFEQIIRRKMPDSILVQAHPFSFLPDQIVDMMGRTGFSDVKNLTPRSGWQSFAGKQYRPAFLGKKI